MRDPSLVPMLLTGAKYLLKIDGSHRCHFLQLIKDASDVNDIQRRHLPQILPIQLSAVFKRLRRRTDLPVSSDLWGKGILCTATVQGRRTGEGDLLPSWGQSESVHTGHEEGGVWPDSAYYLLRVSTYTWNYSYQIKSQPSFKFQFKYKKIYYFKVNMNNVGFFFPLLLEIDTYLKTVLWAPHAVYSLPLF